jgi:predicted phosphoribosyltransferase
MKFENRRDAGKRLAKELKDHFKGMGEFILFAIPRGGVPVAWQVAKRFNIPMSLVITKKLTLPQSHEVAIGAIAPDGTYGLNKKIARYRNISQTDLDEMKEKALSKVKFRVQKYLDGKQPELKGKKAIIVDDGIATGFTAKIAAKHLRNRGAVKIVLAIPVGPVASLSELKNLFDEVVCVNPVESYSFAVGAYYKDFHQNTDKEIFSFIEKAKKKSLFLPI